MRAMASAEEMLERLFRDGMNGGDDSVIDAVLAEDYNNHTFGAAGRDAMKGVVAQFRAAFPDLEITVAERIVDGDRVAQRGHFTGTHEGDFAGLAATGRSVTIQFMDWWVVRDGLLADNWVVMDFSPLAAS
jgi:predicted ester cyclase